MGNILVIVAQVFLAGMFVYEEKILNEYKIKVFEIVGWEGIWGMLLSLFFILIFYLIPGDDYGSLENPIQATLQIINNYQLLVSILISSLVIGPFNYYGSNLTKYSSAMHRCLVDSSRMCVIWLIAVCCNWEKFTGYQALGYVFIVCGNLLYYEIIKLEIFIKTKLKSFLNVEKKKDKIKLSGENTLNYEYVKDNDDTILETSNILKLYDENNDHKVYSDDINSKENKEIIQKSMNKSVYSQGNINNNEK